MTILQLAAVIVGLGLVAFALLAILGGCRLARKSDDASEQLAARMKAADHE